MANTSENLEYIEAKNITILGIVVNIFLSSFKMIVGIFGKSAAIFADGMHSLSDLLTDIATLISIKISKREKDKTHQYGHGKFETFGAMIIGFILTAFGVALLISSFNTLTNYYLGKITLKQPSIIALFAALLSIIAKETLFWYTKKIGDKTKSSALIANAFHHRSDAFSSIATTIGIGGAIILGNKWLVLDPFAALFVSILIIKMAFDVVIPCIKELVENSLPEQVENEISNCIKEVSGVKSIHNLKTRKIGASIAIEVHVKVDKNLSVEKSHKIATNIEQKIKEKFGYETHIGVHIEPFYDL